MNKTILFLSILFFQTLAFSQPSSASAPEMADRFREEGKIYVVIAVIAVVFICLAVYLFSIERKLKSLEKENQENK